MTYRRPPSPSSAVDALARTMTAVRDGQLRAPLAGGRRPMELYAGTVLADNVAQQVISTPWRARSGALWSDVWVTIDEVDDRLLIGIQSMMLVEGDDQFSAGLSFEGGKEMGVGSAWSTVDVLCYVGSTLVDTVALTTTTTTKRKLLNVPVPENGRVWFKIKVDSSTDLKPGGGRPPASRVVAASDAPDVDKAAADYVCDGSDDEVQINAAIDDLATTGGRVLLTAGNFDIGDGILVDQAYVTLEGQGQGTLLTVSSGVTTAITVSATHGAVRHLRMDIEGGEGAGATAISLTSQYAEVEAVHVSGYPTAGVSVSNTHNRVLRAWCEGGGDANTTGIITTSGAQKLLVHGNYVDGFEVGMDIGGNDTQVGANFVYDVDAEGIIVSGDECQITDNRVDAATSDGILIEGDRNHCVDNWVSNAGDYSIKVASGATSNRVVSNTLVGGSNGDLEDLGTTTVKLYPASGHANFTT